MYVIMTAHIELHESKIIYLNLVPKALAVIDFEAHLAEGFFLTFELHYKGIILDLKFVGSYSLSYYKKESRNIIGWHLNIPICRKN